MTGRLTRMSSDEHTMSKARLVIWLWLCVDGLSMYMSGMPATGRMVMRWAAMSLSAGTTMSSTFSASSFAARRLNMWERGNEPSAKTIVLTSVVRATSRAFSGAPTAGMPGNCGQAITFGVSTPTTS